MNVMGIRSTLRLRTAEPQPGCVLVEHDRDTGMTTTFTLNPPDGGRRCRVTFETDARAGSGLRGLLERWLNPGILGRIYRAELAQMADYARSLN